jgi:hypothetical protein
MAILVPALFDYDTVLASATESKRAAMTLLTKLYASLPTQKRELDTSNYMVLNITFAPQPEWNADDINECLAELSCHDGDPFGDKFMLVKPAWDDIQQAENDDEWGFTISWDADWLEYAQDGLDADESAVDYFIKDSIETLAIQIAVRWSATQPGLTAAQRHTISAEFSGVAVAKTDCAWNAAHPAADA